MGRYHHGNLPQALVDAAVAVIEAEGVHGLSLRKAARAAGVSHAAPAHHFGDLRGLLSAVATRGYDGLLEAMKQGGEGRSALDRLRQVGQGYIEFAAAHPALFRAMYHPELSRQVKGGDQHHRAADHCLDYVAEVVADCQVEGTVRAGDARSLAVFAWSAVHGAAVLHVDGRLSPEESDADVVTRHMFLGLRPV